MPKANERAVELILDASSSMKGERLKDAKEVLKSVVAEDLPDDIPVAVRVFGKTGGCSTELVRSLTPLTATARKELQETIEGIEAVGKTSIANSLAMVKEDLADATGERHVVLLTDGVESCGGDVEAAFKDLKNLGFDVRVDIVGLAPADSELHKTFEKWAEVAGGAYLKADDSPKLRSALQEVLAEEDLLARLKELGDDAVGLGEAVLKFGQGALGSALDRLKSLKS